jgi:hypothetical protein
MEFPLLCCQSRDNSFSRTPLFAPRTLFLEPIIYTWPNNITIKRFTILHRNVTNIALYKDFLCLTPSNWPTSWNTGHQLNAIVEEKPKKFFQHLFEWKGVEVAEFTVMTTLKSWQRIQGQSLNLEMEKRSEGVIRSFGYSLRHDMITC